METELEAKGLKVNSGADSEVVEEVRCSWKKFRELQWRNYGTRICGGPDKRGLKEALFQAI